MKKRIRGIIAWDFDGVLFDIERFRTSAERIFAAYGVLPSVFRTAILRIRKEGGPFSVARAFRIMRSLGAPVKERVIRKAFHDHLAATRYFTAPTDTLLGRLRSAGFIHIILSFGASSYQRKKIRVGCGEKFIRHFTKISSTHRPKFLYMKALARRYPKTPIFFVDDTKKNLELVKKYVPEVVTIFYSNLADASLKMVEKSILRHARN